VAVGNASPPKVHCCKVPQQPGSCRNLATKDVVQFTGAGIPGHQRSGCGGHLAIVTNYRWPVFYGYGSSSQCRAPSAWFLRATPVANDGKASWCCSEWSRSILALRRMHHLHYLCFACMGCVLACSLRTSLLEVRAQAARMDSMQLKAGILPQDGAGQFGLECYSSLALMSIFKDVHCLVHCGHELTLCYNT